MAKKVFVDLDGVMVDFITGVLKLHDVPYVDFSEFKGTYALTKILNMTPMDFWKHIDQNESFWENLEKTEEADEIINFLEQHTDPKNIFFLSSPSRNPDCHHGKAKWIWKYYPKYLTRLILTGHKQFLADRDRLLIDDNDEHCNKFKEAGGRALLFPRPWNTKYAFAEGALELFKKEVRRFL